MSRLEVKGSHYFSKIESLNPGHGPGISLKCLAPADFIQIPCPVLEKTAMTFLKGSAKELKTRAPLARGAPMRFFLSKRDHSYLLVMDSTSKAGNVFKVMPGETWRLIWSGVVTEEFLQSPEWDWEPSENDPKQFPGGWPRLS
jgi:hypothetical protein